MATPVLHRRNDHLEATLFDDGSLAFVHLATGERWTTGRVALQEDGPIDIGHVWPRTERSMCEQFPGRFRAKPDGDAARVTLLGRLGEETGAFTVRLELDGDEAEVRIEDISASLPSLVYPPPIVTESLVLPRNVGEWRRQPLETRHFYALYGQINMRWFGGLRGDRGWIAIFTDGHADAGVMAAKMTAAPGWLRSLGKWTPNRAVRYRFTAGGGYVGLAKAFRSWAQSQGLVKPLEQKIAERPALRQLVGGRILSFMQARPSHAGVYEERMETVPTDVVEGDVRVAFTHADVSRAIKSAAATGLHGLAVVRGWIRGGYDESHPDIWPPEPTLGSLEELRAINDASPAFPVALHDNYQDIYPQCPSFPRGVIRDERGNLMVGGPWAGGQAYILSARAGLEYARRNWPQIASLGMPAFFPDTVTAVRLYENHDPEDRMTRFEDEALKVELLGFFRDQGLVLGSEEAADFGAPLVDWFENRHARVPGQSIPLWPLVFGDTAFNARYRQGGVEAEVGPGWLTDMLWGYVLLRGHDESPSAEDRQVDAWNAEVAGVEMVDHRYLDAAGRIERTQWANGRAVTANFSDATFDGIPPGGYRTE